MLACAFALGGCRAVIGIEDLSYEGPTTEYRPATAGNEGEDGGAAEGGALDATAGPDADAEGIAEAGGDGCSDGGLARCGSLCEGSGPAQASAFYTDMTSCICRSKKEVVCAAECVGFCADPQGRSTVCEACILAEAFRDNGACHDRVSSCSPGCTEFAQCAKRCP